MSDGRPPEHGSKEQEKAERTLQVLDGAQSDNERACGNESASQDSAFNGANDEALAIRLATLEQEHRDLDSAITSLELNSPYERLTIARLKKKKLALKDLIEKAKDAMRPDIIA